MPEVELIIKVSKSEAVNNIKDIQKAHQDLHTTVERGMKREKGLIEDIESEIEKLEKAKKKAWRVEDIEKYNRKVAEAKKDLQGYEKAGVEANKKIEKSGNSLLSSIGKWAIGFATVTAAIKAFSAIMNSTQKTADFLKREILGLKTALGELYRSIAAGNIDQLGRRLAEARQAGRDYATTLDNIGDRERELLITESKRKVELAELAKIYRNTALGYKKQSEAAEEYIKKTEEGLRDNIELSQIRLKNELNLTKTISGLTEEEILTNLERAKYIEANTSAIEKYRQAVINLAAEEAKRRAVVISPEGIPLPAALPDPNLIAAYKEQIAAVPDEIKNLSEEMKKWNLVVDEQRQKIVNAITEINNKKAEAVTSTIRANVYMELANKETLKTQDEFYKLSLKLQDDYDKSNIESLTGEAKLKAQREFGIKQIKEFRDQLAELGTITDEQMALFEKMGENVWKIYYEGIAKQAKPTDAQKEAITKSLLAGLPTLEGLQKSYIRTIEDVSPLDKEFSLWNIIGLDPEDEEGKEIIDAIKETAGKVGDVLDDIFQRRVDDAQRTRELLDIRIAETQRSLELEMDLLEEGYANNVDAKKREVEALQKQRDAALKAEEKAIKQEQLLAKISQTTNILSGVSNIIETYTKIPIIGLILAAAAIASLFAIWGKAKSSASSATFAEGASGTEKGIITGRSHAAGGERFLDHVEVERGEAFGVLSRKATDKYGKVFHNMVSSFNRDEMPDILMGAPVVNSPVTVENSGPNSRLDKVIIEQRKLNEQFGRQTQMSTSGNKRIIKQGNKIRIIG